MNELIFRTCNFTKNEFFLRYFSKVLLNSFRGLPSQNTSLCIYSNNIVFRNTWLGNTVIIFVIKQICWQVDLTVHNIALIEIWWNMLIKFGKQIDNSLAKIINTKVNSRSCWTSEMELFPSVVTGSRGKFRILPNI